MAIYVVVDNTAQLSLVTVYSGDSLNTTPGEWYATGIEGQYQNTISVGTVSFSSNSTYTFQNAMISINNETSEWVYGDYSMALYNDYIIYPTFKKNTTTTYTFYYTCYDTSGNIIQNQTSTTSTASSKTITAPSISGYTYQKCGRGTSSTNAYSKATSTSASTSSSITATSTYKYVAFIYDITTYNFYYTCYDTNGNIIKNTTSTTSTTSSKTITAPSINGYTCKKCGRGTSSTNAYNNATSTGSSVTATLTYQYAAFIYEENPTKPYWRNYNSTSSPLNASSTSLVTSTPETINPYEVIRMYFKSTVDGIINIEAAFNTGVFCSIGLQGALVLSEASNCSGNNVVTGELASYSGAGDGKISLNYNVTANTIYEIAYHGYLMSYSGPGTITINFTKTNNYYCKVYAALVSSKGVIQNETYAIISNLHTISATSAPTLTTSMIAPISITGYYYSDMNSSSITSTSSSSPTIIYYYYRPISYPVLYEANGGTFSGSSTTRYYNESYTLTSIEPTRSDYEFLGWSTSSTATTASYSSGATVPASTSTSNITYYAVWGQKFYLHISRYYYENGKTNIDFDGFDILLPKGTYIVPSDYAEQALQNDTEKARFEYVDTNESSFYLNEDSEIVLYFKGKEYSINYYANDDNNTILNQTYIHHPFEIYTNIINTIPEKFGYNFLGWDTSNSATNVVYTPNQEFEKLIENINLYGVWSKMKKEPFYWTNSQDIKLGSDSKLINTHINSSKVNEFINLIKFFIDKNAVINQVSKETKITKDFYNSLALLLGITTLSLNEKITAQHWIDLQDAYNNFYISSPGFKKVQSFQSGKEYVLLMNYNNAYYYLGEEKFNDYTIKAIPIDIELNNTLDFDIEPTLFTATASGNGFTLKTGNNFLYGQASSNSTSLQYSTTKNTIFTIDTSSTGGFDSDEIIAKVDNSAIWIRSNLNNQNCSLKYESGNTSVGIDYKDRNTQYSTGFISFILYEKQ